MQQSSGKIKRNLSYWWQTRTSSCLWDICLQTVLWPSNWGWGHSRSSKVPPFGSSGMFSYSTSLPTMAVSHTVSEIHRFIGQKSPIFSPLLYLAPPLGMKPSELSNNPRWHKTRMMGLSGGKRILTKTFSHFDTKHARHTQTEFP